MKRSGYLWLEQGFDINKAGLKIWGYDTQGHLVCRMEINGAGVQIFTGPTRGRLVAKVNWEQLVEKLRD